MHGIRLPLSLLPSPKRRSIPGPSPEGLLGHLGPFRQDPLAFLSQLRSQYGAVARFRIAHLPYVLVSSPAGIEQVLVHQHDAFRKHQHMQRTLGDALGQGLLTTEGQTWLRQRRSAQPSFRPAQVRGYAATMVDRSRKLAEAWEPGRVVRVDEAMMDLTLSIAGKTLFDVDVGEARSRRLSEAMEAMMERFRTDHRLLQLLPPWLPLSINRRYRQGMADVHALVQELVEERRRQGPTGDDLLSRLLHETEDVAIPDDQLRDHLVTQLIAGHETTALALSWTLHLLARHPEVQERLAADVREALDGSEPAPDHLDQLPLLGAVVDEGLRLYPPAWGIGREATRDVEVDGHELAEGTQVFMSQWVVHRDPAHWADPEVFDPDRWLDDRERPRFAYFPFGGGPRTCIGNSFARLEAQLVLATLLHRHRFVPAVDAAPVPEPAITLRPRDGIHLRVVER